MTSPLPMHRSIPHPTLLRFVRHGATTANLAGLRCGGDLDLPLTDLGRQQAHAAAQHIAALSPPVGLIVTSDLQRTRDTAAILAQALGGLRVVVVAGFAERRLGLWNGQPIADTQHGLEAGLTPPGGESESAFSQRIATATRALAPRLAQRPLLVGSRGVARVLGELCGLPGRLMPGNGEVHSFDLAAPLQHHPLRAERSALNCLRELT